MNGSEGYESDESEEAGPLAGPGAYTTSEGTTGISGTQSDGSTVTEQGGTYADPGVYTTSDGNTGYGGTQSDFPVVDEGDYEASIGATFAVIGLGGELAVGIGGAYGVAAGLISESTEAALGAAAMVADMAGGVVGYLLDD